MYLAEYIVAKESPGPPTPTEVLRSSWEPPPRNRYKVNVDGALLTNQKSAGVGVIIRDSEGRVEVALSKKLGLPLGALEIEAKAFKTNILFAKDIGVHNIILEGDSLIVYRALTGLSNPPLSMEPLIAGMLTLCKEFRQVQFAHVRRQVNKVAHLLAKHAQSVVDFTPWIEENPCFIEWLIMP